MRRIKIAVICFTILLLHYFLALIEFSMQLGLSCKVIQRPREGHKKEGKPE